MQEAILQFKARLRAGETCIGAAITLADPLVTEAIADSVAFVWIDLEHSPMSPEVVQGHLLAARAKQKPSIVRVTGSSTPFIKPVLDAGADGIVVPQVRTAEEVRQVVDDCRYPPLGRRGYGPRVPSNYGRDGGSEYIARANQAIFVAVQIENVEALEALDDILAIPGLDSVVIGPQDLSGSMGLLGQIDHPNVNAAIDSIIAKARTAGKFVGAGMGNNVSYAVSMARRGVQWLQVGGDCSYMIQCADLISTEISYQLADAQKLFEKE